MAGNQFLVFTSPFSVSLMTFVGGAFRFINSIENFNSVKYFNCFTATSKSRSYMAPNSFAS